MQYGGQWIWEALEIAPTKDPKEIKRAFSRRAKTCHPEEQPEEFKILFDAYQLALKQTKISSDLLTSEYTFSNRTNYESDDAINNGTDSEIDNNIIFDEIERLEQQESSLREEAIVKLNNWNSIYVSEDWEDYFKSEQFKRVQNDPLFIEFLGQWLQTKYINITDIYIYLWQVYGLENYRFMPDKGKLQNLYRVIYPAYNQACKRKKQEKHNRVATIFFLAAVGIMIVILFIYNATTIPYYFSQPPVEEWLEKQYQMDFQLIKKPDVRLGDNFSYTADYTFQPLEYPEDIVTVNVSRPRDGRSTVYKDNYKETFMKQKAQEYGLSMIITKIEEPNGRNIYVFKINEGDDINEFAKIFVNLYNNVFYSVIYSSVTNSMDWFSIICDTEQNKMSFDFAYNTFSKVTATELLKIIKGTEEPPKSPKEVKNENYQKNPFERARYDLSTKYN